MHFAFSSNAYTNYDILNTIHSVAKIGYEGIELLIDHPHIFLPISKQKIISIKNQIKYENISVSNLNVNTVSGYNTNKKTENKFEPSLSNTNQKLRNWRISYTKQAIDLATILESPSICITSGILNKNNILTEIELFKNSLIQIAEYAEKKNIYVSIEYEPGLLISTCNDVIEVTHDFKNVGINLDTCHAYVLGEDLLSIIKNHNKKLFHIHLSDCKNKVHYHILPGKGEIDFMALFKELKTLNFDRFISVELYTYNQFPNQAAQESFNYLQEISKMI